MTWNYQIMDYFFDQERPDVVAAAADFIVRVVVVFVFGDTMTTLTLRRLMSYIYGAPILDVSRSHTTTQHSR